MAAVMNNIKSCALKDNVTHKGVEEIADPWDKEVLRPFTYLTSIPGKQIRQTLIETLNFWMEMPPGKLEIISEIIFNVHNYSLLIDDIQDNSTLRRGSPAAHTVFGIDNTVNAATFVVWKNLGKTQDLNHPRAVKVSIDSLMQILAGQGMEIYWRDNFICPTEEEYIQMVTRKTGGIFHFANNLIQLFATKEKKVDKFLTTLGLYFQINDDYQNLKNEVFFNSKGFCEDLTEGKFGYPMVHAINSCPKKGELILDILRQRTTDIELKKECVALIESCGSFEYTLKKVADLRRIIFEEIAILGANPFMDTFFEKIIGASL